MSRGQIKFFTDAKGYGFVVPDDGGPDVYFHVGKSLSEEQDTASLIPGALVEFEIETGRDGRLRARDLTVI